MSQKTRPNADISNEGWAPTPLFMQINETEPANDGTFVFSPDNPNGNTFEVKLDPLAWPDLGTYTLKVRLRKNGGAAMLVTFTLLQGSTSIASRSVFATNDMTTYDLTLSPGQIQQITNYTDLRVRVRAGVKQISVACCGLITVPDTLFAVINTTCVCLNQTIALYWNESRSSWESDFFNNECTPTHDNDKYGIFCISGSPPTWTFASLSTGCELRVNGASAQNCGPPFQLQFDVVDASAQNCDCGGPTINGTVTIVETPP